MVVRARWVMIRGSEIWLVDVHVVEMSGGLYMIVVRLSCHRELTVSQLPVHRPRSW